MCLPTRTTRRQGASRPTPVLVANAATRPPAAQRGGGSSYDRRKWRSRNSSARLVSRPSVGIKLQSALAKLYTHLFLGVRKGTKADVVDCGPSDNVAIVSAFVY